jgi:hypothetical protein
MPGEGLTLLPLPAETGTDHCVLHAQIASSSTFCKQFFSQAALAQLWPAALSLKSSHGYGPDDSNLLTTLEALYC